MYRKEAGLRFAECAELAAYAGGVHDTDNAALAKSTWTQPDTTTEADFSAPLASEVLNEIGCRIDAIRGQLEALADPPDHTDPRDTGDLDYLLEQFRVLTFTVSGTLSGHMDTAGHKFPDERWRSIHAKFVALADQLGAEVRRAGQRDDRFDEIQRQARSVSHKMALVNERRCGGNASDLMDELESILADFDAAAYVLPKPRKGNHGV